MLTLLAGEALFCIAFHPYKRKITHGLEKYRNRADVFAKRPVVLECESEGYTHTVVEQVAADKGIQHDFLNTLYPQQEKCADKAERGRKCKVANPTDFLSRFLGYLVRQKVQNHCRPAGVTTPATTEEQRAEYLSDTIVDNSGFKYAKKQIILKSFYLHILAADNT